MMPAWREVVEADQVNLVALAMLGHFQKIENTEEA
jgi:hypothetical protein